MRREAALARTLDPPEAPELDADTGRGFPHWLVAVVVGLLTWAALVAYSGPGYCCRPPPIAPAAIAVAR